MDLLSLKDVEKTYGPHKALDTVSLAVKKGGIYGLLGPNGAGKTTLIRIINQITAPDSGGVLFEGEPLQSRHGREIGYLPEERGLYPKMKVGEHLLYLARLKGLDKNTAFERISYWLNRFELEAWEKKPIEELSKGMAQKVQFIVTVLHRPKLLIFDEPFTGFDPINTDLIKDEIRKMRDAGATVIFSTHRMESVEEICDDIALINHSQKILEGNLAEVKADFKEDIFSTELRGKVDPHLPEGFTIAEQETMARKTRLRILSKGSSEESEKHGSELLKYLANNFEVISFREELPSLNEIFIKKVREK